MCHEIIISDKKTSINLALNCKTLMWNQGKNQGINVTARNQIKHIVHQLNPEGSAHLVLDFISLALHKVTEHVAVSVVPPFNLALMIEN